LHGENEMIQENDENILMEMEEINLGMVKLKKLGLRFLVNHGKEHFDYMVKLSKTDVFDNLENPRIILKNYSFSEFGSN
jgi:hypothetical protein